MRVVQLVQDSEVIEKFVIADTEVWLLKSGHVYLPNCRRCLTLRYSQLLMYLYQNQGRVIDHSELLNKVWGCEFYTRGNINVTLCALRRIFKDNEFRYFQTIRACGLLLDMSGGL